MSTHAASGVIPLLNFLLCRIEDIQSAITEISLSFGEYWDKALKALYIFPCFHKWIIGFIILDLLVMTEEYFPLSFIISPINYICLNLYFCTPSPIKADIFITDEF